MLEEKILNDYKEALKNRDSVRSSALSFLRAELLNTAIAKKKKSLDDNDVITVVKKQIKQHQDSIEQFTKGMRQDLADKEAKELEILKVYLPPQISAEELEKIVTEVIAATAAEGLKDMGRVMKEVNAKVAGGADGKMISNIVKEKLTK